MDHPTVITDYWQPSARYPDPAITALDPRFEKYWNKLASVERIATGLRWGEGPVYFGDGRYLIWSDIPNNRMMKWEEETGAVSVFRKPSNFGNGNTRDRQGRLITCEHGRRITRTEYDGSITVLMDSFEGKKLNSPNDVVVKSDDSIWFTDPSFGIMSDYEGYIGKSEIGTNVYRIDGKTGKPTIVAEGILQPNGLAFSPDEKILYIVESRGVPNRKILAYDVSASGDTISNKRILLDAGPGGTPDGFRVDIDGNLWCGWGMGTAELDGVMVFAPDGTPIGRIALPERCANVCFGGPKRNRLFMASAHAVYALYTNAQGALGG